MQLPYNFNNIQDEQKLEIVLNDAFNIKATAQFIMKAMDLRSLLNDQY